MTKAPKDHSQHDEFDKSELDLNWNTLRQPFTKKLGTVGNGELKLVGNQSLSSNFDVSFVARRWQAFNFDAETKVKFDPFTYQQMAGLANFYNDKHYSSIFITWDEKKGHVIEVAQNDDNNYTSYLKDDAIAIPDGTEYVWFRTKVRKQSYTYEYSFDGKKWETVPVELDAAILSDDYVLQTSGGFFTGAFVGLYAVDYAGYGQAATFDHFDYKELPDNVTSENLVSED